MQVCKHRGNRDRGTYKQMCTRSINMYSIALTAPEIKVCLVPRGKTQRRESSGVHKNSVCSATFVMTEQISSVLTACDGRHHDLCTKIGQ